MIVSTRAVERHVSPHPPEKGGWLRRMTPYIWAHKGYVILALLGSLITMVVTASLPIIQKLIVDDAILAHRRSLSRLVVIMIGAGAARFVFAFVPRFFGGRVSLNVQYDLRNTIYDQLQRLDFARHDELQTGQLVSRANSDVTLIQSLLGMLPLMTGSVIMFFLSLFVMFKLSPLLTIVALLVLPSVWFTALRMRSKIYPASWFAQQSAAEVAGVVDEAVTGVRVVKGFGQEKRELDRLTDAARTQYGARLRTVRLQARYGSTFQTLPALGQVAILALGGWLAITNHITLGTFLAFSSYLIQLVAPVRMFANMLSMAQQARAGAERILELLDSMPDVKEKPGATDLPHVEGSIAFDDVSFGYLRSEPVLRNFTLRLSPGDTVALVGGSGSGKSTVSLLLPRFYDVQEGAVRVDGVDVRDVTLDSLRSQIGVVFEESFLFSDSVRDNIAYGKPDATIDEVVTAAKAAEAHDFVMALPDGYETVVGERGLTLSGGQRQRLALARALITNPRLLVLDDATSSVDARIEEEIHDTLRRLMQGRTTILVAHRRSTLRLANRIAVVDEGMVIDQGTHEELLARCRLYRDLLAGPGDDVEGLDAEEGEQTVTASAWTARDGNGNGQAARPRFVSEDAGFGGGGMGMGMGGGGGGGWMRGAMGGPPTPELTEALEKLPPIDDKPKVDIEREARHDPHFTLRRFLRPYRGPLALGLLIVVLDAVLTLAGPVLVRWGIDHGVIHKARGALWLASVLFLVAVLVDWWATWAETRQTGKTASRLLFGLRVRIFSHLQRLSLDYYDREMAGRIMTRMTTDVEALWTLLQTGLLNALVNLVTFVGVAVALFLMNARLALITMVVVPPLVVTTWWFRLRSQQAYGKARERIAAVNANLQESLSGVRVAQAFVRERRNMSEFRQVAAQHLEARVEAQVLQSVYFPFVEFLSVVATAIVMGAGSRLIAGGSLTPGELIAFVLYLTQFFTPIQQLSQVFDTYQQAKASMDRISELMATPTMTPEAADPIDPGRIHGHIAFDAVRFRYPGAPFEALRGVDLEIPAGQTVALVGETGAGKSTIVKLVARFYDATEGRVLVDGLPITELDLAAFRHQLGYVPQEAFLFTGTIRDNIAYGKHLATDIEVERAARAVGAHAFIAELPDGYLNAVSERGRSLSSGQRQLIALARAYLVDPAILLLDEATSNLDLATEARVNRAMGLVAEGRTTLVIAHRLQTAKRADRIVVVHDGCVVEDGTHDALLARGGRYAEMWEAFDLEKDERTEKAAV